MDLFKRPRLVPFYGSDSDDSSSDSSFLNSPSTSSEPQLSYDDFAARLRNVDVEPITSTQNGMSEELFTDSEVSEYQRTLESRSGMANGNSETPLPSIATPLPVPNYVWTARGSTTLMEPFTEVNFGWTVPISETMKEVEFWDLVFPRSMLTKLVKESNNYAIKVIEKTDAPSRRQQHFKVISENEMARYLLIRILMGIDHKPELVHYWSKDPILRNLIIPQIMSSDRFFEIQRYLHLCNDDEEEEQEENDKIKKIRAFWETAMAHFSRLVIPSKNISVDESLTKFKGRLSFKQFIPTKRNRFGIKSYSIVDESTKFVMNSVIYVGKDDTSNLKYDKAVYGHGGAVLLELCEPYFGKNRMVFADNYFTSPIVAEKLLANKTYLCGTLRANQKHIPKAPKMKKDEMLTYCCEKENQDIMVEYWRDKRIVRMISTGLSHSVQEVNNARGVLKSKLETINAYNENARGVDQCDMFIGYYDTGRKTLKWSTKMFFRLLELFIYNSFTMMRSFHPRKPFLQFRLSLLRQLLERTGGISFARQQKVPQPNIEPLCDDRLTRRCVNPGKGTKRRCVVCAKNGKVRRTVYTCKNCNVPLCIIPCFEIYHTKKQY